jgi:alcohol-forming fatty acyl-CoA reductase
MKYLQIIEMNKYFTARDWQVENGNIVRLDQKLMSQGITEFEFDVKTIDWNEYFENYIPGFKKYYFKESFDNLDQLRAKYKR